LKGTVRVRRRGRNRRLAILRERHRDAFRDPTDSTCDDRGDIGGCRGLVSNGVVREVRAAQNIGKGHRLRGSDILIIEKTRRGDRQVIPGHHAVKKSSRGRNRRRRGAVIHFISRRDPRESDRFCGDIG